MGEIKNLSESDAIEKVKELAEEIDICMLCTYENGRMMARPMSTQKVDDEGNVWFLSDKSSDSNRQIENNNEVDLLYSKDYYKYLALHGSAEILFDKDKIKELWKKHAEIWFTEGVDDPRISVIKFNFDDGHYWDNKNGRIVQLTKMAASLLTGKTMDDGIEGDLENL
ncbi:MAG TPA: pyridoxamine 5'-phosphate oxidase family protein [Ignavibacteria bacterium]|nr:pyridoxamine 5'-phosphate oxidase family protein [Ignavibacteria bacterium]HQY53410.1 pyridoxamine 5'-phosphate oxidase family protein [Ignavibacteria bacterium]HRB00615.1 pyridoxamine 5'-phosphate oxidase family protein [Ignavibacteria bacterium]